MSEPSSAGLSPIPQPQLKQLAEDVGYELQMLATVAPMATPAHDQFLGSALLEATLLHVRNLDEFFRSTHATEDDVIARHYLAQWTATPILTDDERHDVNKRLMHLSRQRIRLHAEWDRVSLARRALDVLDRFLVELRQEHPGRAAWFESTASAARQRLSQ